MRASVVAVVVAVGALGTSAKTINRDRAYECEIYRSRVVRVPYTRVGIDDSRLEGRQWALIAVRTCSDTLVPLLQRYFGVDGYEEAFRDRERAGMPAFHFRGEAFLERAKALATAEAATDDALGGCLAAEPAMARLSVMRAGTVYFSKAFDLAPGLQAFNNIDEMRIRTVPVSAVLAPLRHGDRVPSLGQHGTVGYFESGTTFQIVMPVISDGEYLADLYVTFYSTDTCGGDEGQK